jgi:hypothetical protein
MFGQKRKNKTRDVVVFLVQRKMAGVEQVDLGIRQVALERLRAGSDERRIVPAPGHQNRRLVVTQPCLPRRVRSDVCPVVVQQLGLDLALAGPRQVVKNSWNSDCPVFLEKRWWPVIALGRTRPTGPDGVRLLNCYGQC